MFAGSFNPFTIGHASIVERALPLVDKIVIAIGENIDKPGAAGTLQSIQELYASEPRVEVITYTGLTVDAARDHACRFLLRGVRSVKDFEAEMTLADINRRLAGIETIFIPTLPELSYVSSSMVRELAHHGHDISPYIPTKQ
ncbi:MAG: pantetheine-phosphate adenylyltransferase [Bacteroidales bacterium]|nr:pantetheine-phosphate adenylyltransferase [Bacteroidales bacterium]